MPHVLCIDLDRARAPWLPPDCTDALHAQVFAWLRIADSRQAQQVHDRGQSPGDLRTVQSGGEDASMLPATRFPVFTVGSANTDIPRHRSRIRPRADGYIINVLPSDERFFQLLTEGMHSAAEQSEAGTYVVQVNGIDVPMRSAPVVMHEAEGSYDDLFQRASDDRRIRLRFTTPAFFSSGTGKQQVFQRLPDPVRVFRGYADRWNAFAPPDQHFDAVAFAKWVEQTVEIADMRLHMHRQVLKQRDAHDERTVHIGFVGDVTYGLAHHARHSQSAEVRMGVRWLNVLAHYAEFCGTGRMAAQGFGQTWRMFDEE